MKEHTCRAYAQKGRRLNFMEDYQLEAKWDERKRWPKKPMEGPHNMGYKSMEFEKWGNKCRTGKVGER